jgi:Flp pilus assembly protein CpaB
MTLKLEEDELVDHAVSNGDLVDIIATTPGKDGKKFTKTICQNVEVLLSLPKDIVLSDRLKSFEEHKITLAVNPVDCEKLAQAADGSKLRLVLRNPASHEKWPLPGADERDVLTAAGLKVDPPKTNKGSSDNTYLGTQSMVPMPPPMPETNPLTANVMPPQNTPLQWVVEMFSGSKRETYAVQK